MKNIFSLCILIATCTLPLLFCGCPAPGPGPDPAGSGKSITTYSIENPTAEGVIDEEAKTILVAVPPGTIVTSLTAFFAATAASVTVGGVEQKSGETANDFTNPVTYLVTAEDGSTVGYVVTVIAGALSSEKAITSYSILQPAAGGEIDQNAGSVLVIVPHGTDVSSLIAVFETTGASVSVEETEQESGTTINDFTDPVSYVVTAEDGSTVSYLVTVEPLPNTEKAITSFSILDPPATGVIDESARIIRVRLPEGACLDSLVAVYATTGALVDVDGVPQVSGETVNDFTGPLDYVVTSEDGSTVTYTVRVVAAIGLVINELDYDQVGTDTAEYIELYAKAEVDLAGIVIIQINGGVAPGQEYARIDLGPEGFMSAGNYLVVAGPNVTVPAPGRKYTPSGWTLSNRIQNGPNDAVMLFDIIGRRVIDTVSYNGVVHQAVIAGETGELDATEGSAGTPADSNATIGSIGRSPNAQDTGQNGADFQFSPALTPGSPNM